MTAQDREDWRSVAEIKAEALREFADWWGAGQWAEDFMAYDVEDDESAVRAMCKALTDRAARVAGTTGAGDDRGCGSCVSCDPPERFAMRMYVCATCGNKRCPAATNCREWECSGSNDPEQVRRRKTPLAGTTDTEGSE